MDGSLGKRVIALRARVAAEFDAANWEEIGLLVDEADRITRHPRLLRSLSWGDQDYSGNVLSVLLQIAEHEPRKLEAIERYVDERFGSEGLYVSSRPAEVRITFSPNVFHVPDAGLETDLVAVMMPFDMEFDGVYAAIKQASVACDVRCLRADDIWEEPAIMQDVFNLIFRASVVVVDFTGKNPNVMYETGIAHTLGKEVVPISQTLADVPFDMRHHRVLKYLDNAEGLSKLSKDIAAKFRQLGIERPWI